MYYTVMEAHLCHIILVGDDQGLCHLHLDTSEGKRVFEIKASWQENREHFRAVIDQLEAYFAGDLIEFDVKLNPEGTAYQKKVWQELSRIPFNELRTYKEVAIGIGNSKASRAVGMANSKNPIPIIVPCHRVVGSNGKLTGFAHGLKIKEKLIRFEKISSIYRQMKNHYGDLEWWPAESDYEMMVGAILTQNTTWTNVEKALLNLGDQLSPDRILQLGQDQLAELIRPSGYYNQKAKKLKAFTEWFQRYDFDVRNTISKDTETLRHELLEIFGVGRETADCILTYSLGKPSFVIDTYTRRLFGRIGIQVPDDYDEFRAIFEEVLGKDNKVYGQFHGLIVAHSKQFCKKTPKCEGCPLGRLCDNRIQ